MTLDLFTRAVFLLLVSRPQYYYERPDICARLECRAESSQDRDARLGKAARVLAGVAWERRAKTAPERSVSILLAHGESETHFAAYVGLGQCNNPPHPSAPRCDPDKQGVPQARTYMQVQPARCPKAWAALVGSDEELAEASRCILNGFSGAWRRCDGRHPRGQLAGAFSGTAFGLLCSSPQGEKRAQTFRSIEGLMHRNLDSLLDSMNAQK